MGGVGGKDSVKEGNGRRGEESFYASAKDFEKKFRRMWGC